MAKSSSTTRSSGTSRIRFIMLDAELAEGDLTQVTQAIQNALRPYAGNQPRVIAPSVPGHASQMSSTADDSPATTEDEQTLDGEVETPFRSERPAKPRKYPSPEVIEVDLDSDPSFTGFISNKKIDSDVDRFLTVAAWFKECRQTNEIGPNHVYTCYRAAHWPYNIRDFAAPLRALKQRQLMTSPSRGLYAINHLVDRL
jgi:hypothetical protein